MSHFIQKFIDWNDSERSEKVQKFLKDGPVIVKGKEDYKLERYIESGTFGDVFISGDKAIKISDTRDINLREAYASKLLSEKCEQYLVGLHEAFMYTIDGETWLIQVQDLMDVTLAYLTLNYENLCNLMVFLLRAVNCLHQNGFAHMDIKSDNIFYKGTCLKLGDLSLVCTDKEKTGRMAGKDITIETCKYMTTYTPPKFHGRKVISFEEAQEIDLWAIGVVLYRKTMSTYKLDARTSLKLGNTTMNSLSGNNPFGLRSGDKIPVKMLSPPKTGPIPVDVYERVLSMLLNENNPTSARVVLDFLNPYITQLPTC